MEKEIHIFKIRPDVSDVPSKSILIPPGTEKLLIIALKGPVCIQLKITKNVSHVAPDIEHMFCTPGTNVICLCKHLKYKQHIKKFNRIELTVLNRHEIPSSIVSKSDAYYEMAELSLQQLGQLQSNKEYFLIRETLSSPLSLQHILAIHLASSNISTDCFQKLRANRIPETFVQQFSLNPLQLLLFNETVSSPFCDKVFIWNGHTYPIKSSDTYNRMSDTEYKEACRLLTKEQVTDIFWNKYSSKLPFVWYGQSTKSPTEYKLRCLQQKTCNSLSITYLQKPPPSST